MGHGVLMIKQSKRNVRLTPARQQVVPLIQRVLDEIDGSFVGLMAHGELEAGQITLASVPSATVRFLPQYGGSAEHLHDRAAGRDNGVHDCHSCKPAVCERRRTVTLDSK